jgi:hypothetical protein
MRPRTVAVLIGALVATLGVAQYLVPAQVMLVEEPPPITRTTGVLKDIRQASWFSSSRLKQATVVLANGVIVEASVVPGCEARAGEPVRIDVLGVNVGDKAYVVVGPV